MFWVNYPFKIIEHKQYWFLSLYETYGLAKTECKSAHIQYRKCVFCILQQIQSPQPQQKWESVPATSHFQLKSLERVDRDRLNVTANNSGATLVLPHGPSLALMMMMKWRVAKYGDPYSEVVLCI